MERVTKVKNKISKSKVNYRKHERRELSRAVRRSSKVEIREHDCMDDLTTMGNEIVCRVCVMDPLVKEVLNRIK